MLFKLSQQIILFFSLTFGWTCCYYDRHSRRFESSKWFYFYNRLLVIAAALAPSINFNVYLPGYYDISYATILLFTLQGFLQSMMVSKFFMKIGALRFQLVDVLNSGVELLRYPLKSTCSHRFLKFVLLKLFFFDVLIISIKMFLVIRMVLDFSELSWLTVAAAILPIFTASSINLYFIICAVLLSALNTVNENVENIINRSLYSFLHNQSLVKKFEELQKMYFKVVNFASSLKRILAPLVSVLFVNAVLNFLVQLVVLFLYLKLELYSNMRHLINMLAVLLVAASEALNLFTMALCVEFIDKSVRKVFLTHIFFILINLSNLMNDI